MKCPVCGTNFLVVFVFQDDKEWMCEPCAKWDSTYIEKLVRFWAERKK